MLQNRLRTDFSRDFSTYFKSSGSGLTSDVNIDELRAYVAVLDQFAIFAPLVAKKSSSFKDGQFTVFLVDPVFFNYKTYNK